jgi:gliding motility-associated-like protein
MSRLSIDKAYANARQHSGHFVPLCLVMAMLGFHGISSAEGTKQLEPSTAPLKSVCKIVLSQNSTEYRIPFALLNCKENFRLNIRINDSEKEKIYLGFGEIINYFDDTVRYTDVQFQVKDPSGAVVSGYSLQSLPYLKGSAGFINNRDEALIGPDIGGSNPDGYKPLVIKPNMTGDYVIEFEIPASYPGSSTSAEMRVFNYFDATVANGINPIPGRLWSKAWQLGSRAVTANINASYSLFYIYTNDSIVTRFDCNGLAGGVWTIYSNQWGCATTGTWSDRRRSLRGNGTVQPEYKIFLSDPDSLVFPSGHIGEMIDFKIVDDVCDTLITFETNVSKAGNIDILLDVDPPNPGSFGPEDVQLGYNVIAGHNVLLPAWDGKDGYGVSLTNDTKLNVQIRFLNGLSNVPLYDVEDNPKGFKVDIQRPKPASGSSKLKLFWDDTQLSYQYFPTSNMIYGCLYDGIEPVSGCHSWTRVQNLGDTNTINSWWYLTTDKIYEKTITLKVRPSSGHITGPANICEGQMMNFKTVSIPFAQDYVWNISGSGFSMGNISNKPDTTVLYGLDKFVPAGEYVVSVFGNNPQCGDGKTVYKQVSVHERPQAAFKYDLSCQGAKVTFTDQSIAADAVLNKYTWTIHSASGEESIFNGNPNVVVFDTIGNYNVSLITTDLLGCIDTANAIIAINAKPESSFEYIENPNNNGELQFDNQTTGASEYFWDLGNNTFSALFEPVVKYDLEGNYTIMLVAINLNGCKDTTMRKYYFMPGLWLPNAFSPNNNNQNELFRPVTQRTTLDPYQLLVFDRWGQLIFKTTNPAEGWDGKYNGQPCPAGGYSYLIQYREAKIESSKTVTLRGMVSLIR